MFILKLLIHVSEKPHCVVMAVKSVDTCFNQYIVVRFSHVLWFPFSFKLISLSEITNFGLQHLASTLTIIFHFSEAVLSSSLQNGRMEGAGTQI
jgi:hypothetical protein